MTKIDRERLLNDIQKAPFWHRVIIHDSHHQKCVAENTDAINRDRVLNVIENQPALEDPKHTECRDCIHFRRLKDSGTILCLKVNGFLYGKVLPDEFWYCKDAERRTEA